MAQTNKSLTFAQRTALALLWGFCRGFALLPHFVRHYLFGYPLYLLLCYVLHYRRGVIMMNLRNSFPEKSEKELVEICRGTYRNLAEQIVNMLSQSGVSDEELRRRMVFPDPEEAMKAVVGENAVFMTAHYGPWESGSIVSLAFTEHTFVAVYHELNNVVFDELFKRIRQHTNVELVSMTRLMRHFIDNKDGRPMILGLISDQNPTIRPNFHWHKFLHQWTAFYNGAELLALKYGLPVYYFSPRRVRAGYYEGYFTCIYDGKEQVEVNEITERYVRLLEEDIVRAPEMWMWTHRRWKHTPPEELRAQKI